MISIKDTLLLAHTKLKTRKIRLFITVFVSSLLFACLVFVSMVSTGILGSISSFSDEGYGGRYLVQATPLTYTPGPESDQAMLDELRPYQKELVAKKKAAAKKLGIQYDPLTDPSLPISEEVSPDGTKQSFLNYGSPKVTELESARNATIPNTSYKEFKTITSDAGAINTFRGTSSFFAFANNSGRVQVIVNGKEKITADYYNQGKPTGVESIQTIGWKSLDADLIKPFVLPGESIEAKDNSVGVIAPFSAAEEILGLKSLPQTASPEERLARSTKVRAEIVGKKFQICYRNAKSAELASTAQQIQTEITKNKDKKDYIKPSLIYSLPKSACGEIAVESDKRTAQEKAEQKKQDDFDKQFGNFTEPKQGLIEMRIIGLSPDVSEGTALDASTILTSLFSSSIGNGWVSPSEDIMNNSLATAAQNGTIDTISRESLIYYAEFKTLGEMKQFIDDQQCDAAVVTNVPGAGNIVSSKDGSDPTTKCIEKSRTLVVTTFGNSAGAIDEFEETIWKAGKILILVIVVLSSLILMANIGKIIADSRRETAVFRALGARRFDITQIYLTYAVMLALIIFGCALAIGFIASSYINSRYTSDFSTAAVLIYNAQDTTKEFRFFGISTPQLGGIALLAVLTGLVSALLPLLANMRRNPINDMRDER
jgi:hypothetical protein